MSDLDRITKELAAVDDAIWRLPDDAFAQAFGTEWFIEYDAQPPFRTGWIFPDS